MEAGTGGQKATDPADLGKQTETFFSGNRTGSYK